MGNGVRGKRLGVGGASGIQVWEELSEATEEDFWLGQRSLRQPSVLNSSMRCKAVLTNIPLQRCV